MNVLDQRVKPNQTLPKVAQATACKFDLVRVTSHTSHGALVSSKHNRIKPFKAIDQGKGLIAGCKEMAVGKGLSEQIDGIRGSFEM